MGLYQVKLLSSFQTIILRTHKKHWKKEAKGCCNLGIINQLEFFFFKKTEPSFWKRKHKSSYFSKWSNIEGNAPTGDAKRQEKFQSHHPHPLTRAGDLLVSIWFGLAANTDTVGTCQTEERLFYCPDLRQWLNLSSLDYCNIILTRLLFSNCNSFLSFSKLKSEELSPNRNLIMICFHLKSFHDFLWTTG